MTRLISFLFVCLGLVACADVATRPVQSQTTALAPAAGSGSQPLLISPTQQAAGVAVAAPVQTGPITGVSLQQVTPVGQVVIMGFMVWLSHRRDVIRLNQDRWAYHPPTPKP